MSTTIEATMVHRFEAAGLGLAPFRVVGVEHRVGPIRTEINGVACEVGAPGQPMGSCAYCGQGIAECWTIRSSDGKLFTVGCECVRKSGDAGLKNAMAPHKAKISHKRDDARIEAARGMLCLDFVRDVLRARPSSIEWRAKKGETMLEWAEWMLSHAGRAGKIRVARTIEAIAAPSN